MTGRRTAVMLGIVAILAAAFSPTIAAEKDKPSKTPPAKASDGDVGVAAPDFGLPDHEGKPVRLSDLRGKIVVLEWINPSCPFVKRHYKAGTMKALAEKYADKGVVWLAVNSTKSYDTAKNKAFAEKHKLPFAVLNDQPGDVGRAYGARTTPDMRVIDAKGTIVYSGAIDDDPRGKKDDATNYVAAAIEDLLAKRKVATPKTKPYGCSVKYAKPREKAAGFTLTDQDGKKVSLADFAGSIVVLEWINPTCPFVRRHYEAGTMKRLAEKYDDRDVVWLAVNSTHFFGTDKNKAWHEKYDLPYPILNDQPGEVGRAYDAKTTPDMRVIDAHGHVAYSGAIDDDPRGKAEKPTNYVAEAIEELLAGKAVSVPRTRPYGCSVKYAKGK